MPAEILTPAQLVEKTRVELEKPFTSLTTNIVITEPPAILFESQRVVNGEGIGVMKPFYFPLGETRFDSPLPDGWVKLQQWVFDQIRAGNVSLDALRIGAFWALFDESRRPNYDSGTQMFEGDRQMGLILAQARNEGQIAIPDYVKHLLGESRFGVSMDEQDQVVFPKLAEKWRLKEAIVQGQARVRRPKVAEFNFAGNLRYPFLGEANTWEGFEDKFEVDDRLLGGSSGFGGLAGVSYFRSYYHYDVVAFRPLVEFSSHNQSLITW